MRAAKSIDPRLLAIKKRVTTPYTDHSRDLARAVIRQLQGSGVPLMRKFAIDEVHDLERDTFVEPAPRPLQTDVSWARSIPNPLFGRASGLMMQGQEVAMSGDSVLLSQWHDAISDLAEEIADAISHLGVSSTVIEAWLLGSMPGAVKRAAALARATAASRAGPQRAPVRDNIELRRIAGGTARRSTLQKTAHSPNEVSFFLPFEKVQKNADGSRIVAGYASTPTLDLDGQIVELDAIKAALPSYMEWGNVRMMHEPVAVGKAKQANVDGTGLFLTAKIVDPHCVQLIDEGVLSGYSIGGRILAQDGNAITAMELIEISVVDRPANPDCRFDIVKNSRPVASGVHLLPIATKARSSIDRLEQLVAHCRGTPLHASAMARLEACLG
jgi:phage head maturation protease/DNA-binding transcriptional regulator YdaS (Cro superfamily)